MTAAKRNWAGNIAYAAAAIRTPVNLDGLRREVRAAGQVRALGSRHSFNAIADTEGTLLAMRGLNRILDIDAAARTVTVEGGITYGELCPALDAAGFALHNLASLPHISVAGAIATATHGSGNRSGNLATAVAAFELVTAAGDVVRFARGDPEFDGAVVGLGALGIVSALTLDIEPAFELRQDVYLDLPFAALVDNFDSVTSAAYSVSSFTRWQGDTIDMVWLKARVGDPVPPDRLFGARPAERAYHPIAALDPAPATAQLGSRGPWHHRLPHFRIELAPSVGAELQSEFFVARRDGPAALRALKAIQEDIAAPLLVSEIRTVAADGLWLSHNFGTDSLAFHFTWQPDWAAVSRVLPRIEAALAPFAVRPHWGKLFTLDPPTVRARYPKFEDFRALAKRLDPTGKFRNRFLAPYLG